MVCIRQRREYAGEPRAGVLWGAVEAVLGQAVGGGDEGDEEGLCQERV